MKFTSRGLRRRGDTDKWEVTLTHKNPFTSKTERTFHTVEARTLRTAERARDELIMELEQQGGAIGRNLTIAQFMDAFLSYKAASGTVEQSTICGYKTENKWIVKYIGAEQLGELNIPAVNRWMADMSADGYAPKTVSKAFRLLKQALKFAQAQDLITKNPCDFCKPPKRVKTKINALSREDRTRMLSIARYSIHNPLSLAIELALTTGMRRGEICALRWSDFDEVKKTISVTHALGRENGSYYVKEPKTAGSQRTIPLTAFTCRVLVAIRGDKQGICKAMGIKFGDPYILGTIGEDTKPYRPDLLSKEYTAFCKINGFECTFHDLRHTFATFMIGSGVDVRTVASYLGHSSVSMTLNTYADVDPEAKMSAVDKIEAAFDMDGLRLCPPEPKLSFEPSAPKYTADELRAMLAEAERREQYA